MNEIVSFQALLIIISILNYCSPNIEEKKKMVFYFPSLLLVFLKNSVFSAFLEKSVGEYCFIFQI